VAADCGEGLLDIDGNKVPAPPELATAWRIQQWGAQTLYNEPLSAGEVARMTAAKNVYDAFISYRAGQSNVAKWASTHPQELEIVSKIREMRMW
jgi:hypothetical protein